MDLLPVELAINTIANGRGRDRQAARWQSSIRSFYPAG